MCESVVCVHVMGMYAGLTGVQAPHRGRYLSGGMWMFGHVAVCNVQALNMLRTKVEAQSPDF